MPAEEHRVPASRIDLTSTDCTGAEAAHPLTPTLGDTHIVIMGHSTGSQDVMHYLTSSPSSLSADTDPNAKVHVQGGIMQAPASDHELYVKFDSQDPGWVEVIRESEEMMREGRGHELMSDKSCAVVKMRMTGYRAWSLHASK